ncbi:hypothetical protein PAXRUDRAFT_835462 [Paxillus rubicundulus Ve08.2h10]|uniref:Uncharacterized protein n=1 Tax=Paxillus rubicundulus Ve08.2h10 TaxID=930991 RepID=A0A0D0CLF0_9AGAM|nr:hypothetical protein PAXRUDRAFT_835462 [Paxillus rubicundulus Ve08.2h10]
MRRSRSIRHGRSHRRSVPRAGSVSGRDVGATRQFDQGPQVLFEEEDVCDEKSTTHLLPCYEHLVVYDTFLSERKGFPTASNFACQRILWTRWNLRLALDSATARRQVSSTAATCGSNRRQEVQAVGTCSNRRWTDANRSAIQSVHS